MKIVIARSFGTYKRGQTFDWQPSFAKILIRRGLIESLETEIESADMPDSADILAIDLPGFAVALKTIQRRAFQRPLPAAIVAGKNGKRGSRRCRAG